jgi:hypothetical protein
MGKLQKKGALDWKPEHMKIKTRRDVSFRNINAYNIMTKLK